MIHFGKKRKRTSFPFKIFEKREENFKANSGQLPTAFKVVLAIKTFLDFKCRQFLVILSNRFKKFRNSMKREIETVKR